MAETLARLIADYGYIAIVLGCFVEGEAVILLGVLAASHTIVALPGVIVAAIAGTIVGDNLWFHIGRLAGRPALHKRPDWRARAARVQRLLERHGAPLMVGFRFLYGLRYITPFVLGSLGVSPWRFLALEAIGTVVWATTVALAGVLLAGAIARLLARIHGVELTLAGVLIGLALAGYAAYRRHTRRSKRR